MSIPSQIEFTVLWPGGNPVALICSEIEEEFRLKIARAILSDRSAIAVQEVGFVNIHDSVLTLEMMGRELSLDAVLSVAAWKCFTATDRKPECQIRCTGEREMLFSATTNVVGEGRVKVTIRDGDSHKFFSEVKSTCLDPNKEEFHLVEFPGIAHFVQYQSNIPNDIQSWQQDIEKRFLDCRSRYKDRIESFPAIGLVDYGFVRNKMGKSVHQICPLVYVKATNKMFFETACGSGSVAVVATFPQHRFTDAWVSDQPDAVRLEPVRVLQLSGDEQAVIFDADAREFKLSAVVDVLYSGSYHYRDL